MGDLTLGQSDLSVVISDAQAAGNIAILQNTDSGYGLTIFEGSRGQKASASSIPVVISSDQAVQASLSNGQATIGTSATQLTSTVLKQGVVIKASNLNSGVIYLGVSGVTTSNGFELSAGETVTLPITNTNLIYAIANDVNQILCFIGN
jgi:hypothetical protein